VTGAGREAARQRWLLRLLLGDELPATADAWLAPGLPAAAGLAAYRAHAGAVAERALSAAFPTVQQLVGDDSFAALARHLWQRHPPSAGDLGEWGGELAAFIAAAPTLADEPCLPDVARLDWAVHQAARAADAAAPQGLERLATHDPAALRMQLAPGTALLWSPHPLAAIWQAHRSTAADRFAAVQTAYSEGGGGATCTRVARQGWRVDVAALPDAEARLTRALLDDQPLADALEAAGDGFDVEAWLVASLRTGLVVAVVAT